MSQDQGQTYTPLTIQPATDHPEGCLRPGSLLALCVRGQFTNPQVCARESLWKTSKRVSKGMDAPIGEQVPVPVPSTPADSASVPGCRGVGPWATPASQRASHWLHLLPRAFPGGALAGPGSRAGCDQVFPRRSEALDSVLPGQALLCLPPAGPSLPPGPWLSNSLSSWPAVPSAGPDALEQNSCSRLC